MVKVLPLPVCPYAKIVELMPSRAPMHAGRATRSNNLTALSLRPITMEQPSVHVVIQCNESKSLVGWKGFPMLIVL